MTVNRWRQRLDELWLLNRVHVGSGMSEACARLAAAYPGSRVIGYPTGQVSGSWRVPPGWEVGSATLTAPDGRVIADWSAHPLSLFAFSPPFSGAVSLAELQHHLLSDPARPAAIPFHFRNQYRHWAPEWGFCLPHAVRSELREGEYRVEIDTSFSPGRLEMVEQLHEGESPACLLFVGHLDHPAMCNDGLVGCLAGHEALTRIADRETRFTYRMLSTVEIIGSVLYAELEATRAGVKEALFVAASGARAPLSYQQSASGHAFVDRVMAHVLTHSGGDCQVRPFRAVFGNDEIAFDVGGVGIPCGSVMRFPFPEYHTSDDTPECVDDANFEETVGILLDLIDVYEQNARLAGRFRGLPCLSAPEIDLYLSPPMMSGVRQGTDETTRRLLDRLPHERARVAATRASSGFFRLMNLLPTMADGQYTTLDLAERAGVPFSVAHAYSEMWVERQLLAKEPVDPFGAR